MFAWTSSVGAAVVEGLVSEGDAAKGLGWAVHPDQVGRWNGTIRGGSAHAAERVAAASRSTAPTGADRALIFTVPKPNDGAPIGEHRRQHRDSVGGDHRFVLDVHDERGGASSVEPGLAARRLPGLQPGQSCAVQRVHRGPPRGWFPDQRCPLRPHPTCGGRGHSTTRRWCGSRTPTMDSAGSTRPAAFGEFRVALQHWRVGPDPGRDGYRVAAGLGRATSTTFSSPIQPDHVSPADGFAFASDFEVPAADNSTATHRGRRADRHGGTVGITLNSSALAALDSTPFTITFSGTERDVAGAGDSAGRTRPRRRASTSRSAPPRSPSRPRG